MLRISFINVGYGDAILIEELRGERRVFSMLVDGGVPYSGNYRASYDRWPSRTPAFRYLDTRGISALDAIFLTHVHIDHVGGLSVVMDKCDFGQIWSNFCLSEPKRLSALNSLSFENYKISERATALEMRLSLNLLAEMQNIARGRGKSIEQMGMERRVVTLSDMLTAEFYKADASLATRTENLMAEILSPDAELAQTQNSLVQLDSIQNAAGVALRLKYAGRKILLPADVPAIHWKNEDGRVEELCADIVKLAHHGQADSMTRELAAKITPKHAVISVSVDNPFGAPSPTVFDMFDHDVAFWITENIKVPPREPGLPPRMAPGLSRRAVTFEIQTDGEIGVSLDCN